MFPGKLLVKEDPGLYHFINQGCLDVDGMEDKEEMKIADVRPAACLRLELSSCMFAWTMWKELLLPAVIRERYLL